jgi:hypothetical protein
MYKKDFNIIHAINFDPDILADFPLLFYLIWTKSYEILESLLRYSKRQTHGLLVNGCTVLLYALDLPESDVIVTAHHFPVVKALLCDALERDLGSLEVRDGTVQLAMPGTIATIRLLVG